MLPAAEYAAVPVSPRPIGAPWAPGAPHRALQLRRYAAACLAAVGACAIVVFVAQSTGPGEPGFWAADEARAATVLAEAGHANLEQQLPADVAKCMNFSTHPCDNFYEFVCGNWVRDAEIPASRGSWSKSWDGAGENVHDEMVSLYTEEDWPLDSPYRRLHDWYASCMDLDHITELGKLLPKCHPRSGWGTGSAAETH